MSGSTSAGQSDLTGPTAYRRPSPPVRTRLSLLGGVGLVVVTGALWQLFGPVGVVVGLGLGGCWYALSAPVAFAVGQAVAAVLVAPLSGAATPTFVGLQAGLFAVLFGTHLRDYRPVRAALAVGVALAAAAVVGVALVGGQFPTSPTPTALVAVQAVSYATVALAVTWIDRRRRGRDRGQARPIGSRGSRSVPADGTPGRQREVSK